jgi:hypothetical protein
MIIHAKRQDKLFLNIHFKNYKLILLTEYLILSLPVLMVLLYHKYRLICIIHLLLTVSLPFFKFTPKNKNLNTKIQQLVPKQSFEWKSGLRKNLFIIMPLWIIGMASSFFMPSVPVVLFILGIIFISFYEKAEPLQMLLASEMSSSKYIINKIKFQLTIFSLISFPLIIGFIIFHYDKWYIPAVEYCAFVLIYVFVIISKYAYYKPGTSSNIAQLFIALSIVVPVFIPFLGLLSIYYYFKAKKNLNTYLNDYN